VRLSALFRQGNRWAVYPLQGGRARLAIVEVGHRNSEFAEVLGGLAHGDRVVLHPSDRVAAGERLKAR
jgi:HlyD family secretion protein